MVQTRTTDTLTMVNMETGAGIDYSTDMLDSVHPNTTGYTKIANLWYSTLQTIIPLHQWGLDETLGTTYLELYRDANGICSSGCPSPSTNGQFDNAQEFNDTAIGGIVIEDTSNLNWNANESFSIEMWINTDSAGAIANDNSASNAVFIGRENENTLLWLIGTDKDDGKLIFYSDGGATNSTNNVADGLWHHIVCVRDANTHENIIYVDGQVQETVSVTNLALDGGNAPLTIGSLNWDIGYEYNGLLDNITIYGGALTADKVKRRYDKATQGSIIVDHYWKLDESSTSATTFKDKYNLNTSGTCSSPNCPVFRGNSQVLYGRYFHRDNNETITVPASTTLEWGPDDNLTIELWVRPDEVGPTTDMVFIGRRGIPNGSGTMGWWIGLEYGKIKMHFEDRNNNPAVVIESPLLDQAGWYHVAVVRDAGNTFTLYVDGVEIGSAPDTTQELYASTPTRFGHYTRPANDENIAYLDGILDDVIIFGSALTPEYIQAHYNKGVAGLAYDQVDTVAPTITLLGTSTITFESGTDYNDSGATVQDNIDGNITNKIVIDNPVAINTAGTYTIRYNVLDFAGNPATEVTRTVTVTDTANPIISEVTPVVTPTSDTTPSYTFYSSENGSITYGGGCTSTTSEALTGNNTISFSALADGSYPDCTIIVTDPSSNVSNTLAVTPFTIDILPPTLTEIIPIASPTADTTPDYTFSSSEAGTIEYVGDCTSSTTDAIAGENTVTFDALTTGEHSNCIIRVTDVASNEFTELVVSTFVVDDIAPIISLTGDETIHLLVNQTYIEAGATCTDNYDASCSVVIGGDTVDTSSVGDFTVTYNTIDTAGNTAVTLTRTVNVAAGNAPVITIAGDNPLTIEVNTPYIEPGASANDLEDGTNVTLTSDALSAIHTDTLGTQTVTYVATDSQDNVTEANRTVEVVDTTKPVIVLTGAETIDLLIFETYVEDGATCTDNYDAVCTVIVGGDTVDTSSVGSYTVTYDVTDTEGNVAIQVTRTVTIADTTKPVIALIGTNQVLEVGTTYIEEGATATDNADGAITNINIDASAVDVDTVGTYTVTYDVTDSSGNVATQVKRFINIVDTTKPVITLNGTNSINLLVGTTYTEQGATCTDNYDTSCNVTIGGGTVDTSSTGSYQLTYSTTDSEGNSAITLIRTVNVTAGNAPQITVSGDNPLIIEKDSAYVEPGVSATDAEDGTTTVFSDFLTAIDTSIVGTQTLTYFSTDSDGNIALATRTIIVESIISNANQNFNTDGIEDIIIRKDTGKMYVWYMNADGTHTYKSIGTLNTGTYQIN